MKFWKFASAVTALVLSTSVNAALVERLGGLAYYDTEADLTWLTDANSFGTLSGGTGAIEWSNAQSYVENIFVVEGIDGWRLPTTTWPDESCNDYDYYNQRVNYRNCSGSEMGNLYYNVLGNEDDLLINTGPFINFQNGIYWSSTVDASAPESWAWGFDMRNGDQYSYGMNDDHYVWLVHDGDVAELSPVPVPSAIWLFGSGLIGLAGMARRKKS